MKYITATGGSRGKSKGVCGGPVPQQDGDDGAQTVMSQPEKSILCQLLPEAPPLEYPLEPLKMAVGPDAQEYKIPEDDRLKVLRELYPFLGCPELEDTRFDLHESAYFKVGDYRVIRELGRNFLVSPYYPSSGGMVIDWLEQEPEGGEPMVQMVKEG